MSWNLIKVVIVAAALISLGADWYNDVVIPAWIAFAWCFCVFIIELDNYLKNREEL